MQINPKISNKTSIKKKLVFLKKNFSIMTKLKQIFIISCLVLLNIQIGISQVTSSKTNDDILKQKMYKKLRNQTLSFNKKQFDSLFFDYFKKTAANDIILTKDEYYNYTVRIGIYSEKLGLLYKANKPEAMQSKKEWLDKNYQDYLNSKNKK